MAKISVCSCFQRGVLFVPILALFLEANISLGAVVALYHTYSKACNPAVLLETGVARL
jgi:hypothetical protein